MERKNLFFIIVFFSMFSFGNTIRFSKCELVKELRRQGFSEHDLRDWVCLIEHESSFDTSAKNLYNSDNSIDWGLFQMNDRYWCSNSGSAGKECNIRCSDLLSDDITVASRCAKLIYSRHGFSAWVAWNIKCNGQNLPDINEC